MATICLWNISIYWCVLTSIFQFQLPTSISWISTYLAFNCFWMFTRGSRFLRYWKILGSKRGTSLLFLTRNIKLAWMTWMLLLEIQKWVKWTNKYLAFCRRNWVSNCALLICLPGPACERGNWRSANLNECIWTDFTKPGTESGEFVWSKGGQS